MKIETKYDIGQTVWVDEGDGIDIVIKKIEINMGRGIVEVIYNNDFAESELYPSKLELYKDRMEKINNEIAKMECKNSA